MIKAVLFDLDGTLLPLDQDYFIETYLGRLGLYLAQYGYDPKTVVKAIYKSCAEMLKNNGTRSNEQVFWDSFTGIFGEQSRNDAVHFEEFYKTDFENVRAIMGYDERAAKIVSALREQGIITILATSPVFPSVATEARMRWAGLSPDLFDLVTTYENSSYCKPNPDYYLDILRRFDLTPQECIMVGNDVDDDMSAECIGMKVFLLTDRLVNRRSADISAYDQGGFAELIEYLGLNI